MTSDGTQRPPVALWRSPRVWERALTRQLGVDASEARRWIEAGDMPSQAAHRLGELLGVRDSPWPRDEWIIGDAVRTDGRRRTYVVHLAAPRFSARIVYCDRDGVPRPEEEPVDASRPTYVVGEDGRGCRVLAEVAWFDDVPPPHQVIALFDAATEAVDIWTLGPAEQWPQNGS